MSDLQEELDRMADEGCPHHDDGEHRDQERGAPPSVLYAPFGSSAQPHATIVCTRCGHTREAEYELSLRRYQSSDGEVGILNEFTLQPSVCPICYEGVNELHPADALRALAVSLKAS